MESNEQVQSTSDGEGAQSAKQMHSSQVSGVGPIRTDSTNMVLGLGYGACYWSQGRPGPDKTKQLTQMAGGNQGWI